MPQTSIHHATMGRFASGPATLAAVHGSVGVGVRPMGSENRTSGFVPLESFHSLTDGTDGRLGRQTEAIPRTLASGLS